MEQLIGRSHDDAPELVILIRFAHPEGWKPRILKRTPNFGLV